MKYKILVVDDETENLTTTGALLEIWGYEVVTATSGDDAISKVKNSSTEFAVILLDYKMPNKNGAETAKEIRDFNSESVIIVYSAYPEADHILASIRAGSVDFIEKDENTTYLQKTIITACERFEETRILKPSGINTEGEKFLRSINVVGRTAKIIDAGIDTRKCRGSKKPTLLLGESGTGKELFARAIHDGPQDKFFAVNCATFANNDLLASELFGHEKGAFTGAENRRVGIFEAARGGTVFLDEIHCLPIESQSQLLRAIREKKIKRVGANMEYPVDFNIVVASKPDLPDRVKQGTFTADLYYRLIYFTIKLPPLRERREDIGLLVLHFCNQYFKETGIQKEFLMKTVRSLESYDWPGNIGELEACVHSLLRKVDGDKILPSHLDERFQLADTTKIPHTLPELEDFYNHEKRRRIIEAVGASQTIAEAAERLGVSRSTLHTHLTRMGMRTEINLKSSDAS